MRLLLPLLLIVIGSSLIADNQQPAHAPDAAPVQIRFEHHRFTPLSLTIRAGEPITLRVVNASKERIEFESFKLNREKVVGPGKVLVLRLPALRPGSYDFYDDFHDDVPQGTIVTR